MSYTLTTWDNQAYALDDNAAKRLIQVWGDADKPFPVDLGSVAISSSNIKAIKPNPRTEADIGAEQHNLPRLKADNRSDEEQYSAARQAAEAVRKKLRDKGLNV